jgi:hypothetical protein
MASYVLYASNSIVQVTGPTTSEDMIAATIQTSPTGIIATILVSQTSFDADDAAETLTAFANSIEDIIAQGKAVGGTGTSDLDANGLQVYYVTFTVGYNPTGVPPGNVTVDVDVPVNLLAQSDASIGTTLLGEAETLVDDAYNSLVALAGG